MQPFWPITASASQAGRRGLRVAPTPVHQITSLEQSYLRRIVAGFAAVRYTDIRDWYLEDQAARRQYSPQLQLGYDDNQLATNTRLLTRLYPSHREVVARCEVGISLLRSISHRRLPGNWPTLHPVSEDEVRLGLERSACCVIEREILSHRIIAASKRSECLT